MLKEMLCRWEALEHIEYTVVYFLLEQVTQHDIAESGDL